MDWRKSMQELNDSMSNKYESSVNALLNRMGLEHKRSTMEIMLPAIGIFGAGIAVGAALGVLFAPKRGSEIRSDLRDQVGQLRDRSYESYEALRARGEDMAALAQDTNGSAKSTSTPQAE